MYQMLCFTICFVHVLKNPLIVTLEGMWPILVLNKKCQTNKWTDFAITYTHCSLPHIQHSHLWVHRLLWCYTLLKAKEYWNLKIPSLDLACVWEEGKKLEHQRYSFPDLFKIDHFFLHQEICYCSYTSLVKTLSKHWRW